MKSFAEKFHDSAAPTLYRAPGRINLIGEHTDYNLGFVMPVALDLACFAAVAPAGDGCLQVYSQNMEQGRRWRVSDIADATPAHDWTDYVMGVARELEIAGYPVAPCNLLLWSTVPVGSGLSSSAAVEVATALALLGGRPIDPLELAKLCRRAENNFVGMPCGIMDQYICVFGRESAAIKIDCRNLENEIVPLPEGADFLAVNTMVKHELAGSAYRDRVAECAAAVAAIRQKFPAVASLRDVSSSLLDDCRELMPETPFRRARHVVTENERVEAFAAACQAGDLEAMGRLLEASHRSLQHDYEVSSEELDFLVDAALAQPGVLGARMTGGGFGGCMIVMVRPEAAWSVQVALSDAYQAQYGIAPEIYPCHPSAGAGRLTIS